MQSENSDYTIFVVDDDETLCELIQKKLQRVGFHTDKAFNGKDAISKIPKNGNVLMLLDYHLADMTAKQVIEELAQNNNDIPFVIMTGHGDERIAVDMMKLKARDYLIKDMSFIDLVPISVNQVIAQLNTEKKLASTEEILKESEERFRNIYKESPIGIAVYDQFGKLIDANKACVKIFHPEYSNKLQNLLNDCDMSNEIKDQLNKGETVRYETELSNNVTIKYLDVLISPLGLGEKKYLDSYLVHIQDITEQKNAKIQLQNMKDDLEIKVKERTAQLAKMNDELLYEISERKEIEKRLADYNSELQLFTEVSSELVANTVYNANKMQSLLNSLLDYSKISMNNFNLQPVNCDSIFKDAIDKLKSIIDETNATITSEPLPTITADKALIGDVFHNLIENAIKFHGIDPPKIHVSAKRNENEWIFSINDNGIGIEQEYKDMIFSIFSRLNNGNGYSGTGIGLAICKKIVEHHSGRIWVESTPGKGSTFYFSIPI